MPTEVIISLGPPSSHQHFPGNLARGHSKANDRLSFLRADANTARVDRPRQLTNLTILAADYFARLTIKANKEVALLTTVIAMVS